VCPWGRGPIISLDAETKGGARKKNGKKIVKVQIWEIDNQEGLEEERGMHFPRTLKHIYGRGVAKLRKGGWTKEKKGRGCIMPGGPVA